ncbi:hypothetical protein M5585_22770 [Serratia ureilytica]
MQQALDYFNQLNQDYLDVHRAKEELFWQNYMGTGGEEVSARLPPRKVPISALSPNRAGWRRSAICWPDWKRCRRRRSARC